MNILTDGLLNLSWPGLITATLVLTHITIASVTIFLHRHQSHRSLTLHPVISHFFRFWLWLTTGMVTKQWVAIHRKHHAKCETVDDPHSPQVLGLKKLLLQGSELYRAEAAKTDTMEKYGKGTPDDWLERNLYGRHPFWGITLMLLIDVLLFGVIGITIFAVQMLWIPFWAAGVINGIGHYWGYRNFEPRDASRNISPLGIFIGGEELHNNHHAYPASAKLSNKWWEFDIGWFYIKALAMLGLARVTKQAARIHYSRNKRDIDTETLSALLHHRFHVLKLYGHNVIVPVLQHERERANDYCRGIYRRVRRFMTREDIHLDGAAQQLIAEATTQSQTLATVYHFKQKLKEVWANTAHQQSRRLQQLQQWCADAEKSGVEVLQEFVDSLRAMTEVHAPAVSRAG